MNVLLIRPWAQRKGEGETDRQRQRLTDRKKERKTDRNTDRQRDTDRQKQKGFPNFASFPLLQKYGLYVPGRPHLFYFAHTVFQNQFPMLFKQFQGHIRFSYVPSTLS